MTFDLPETPIELLRFLHRPVTSEDLTEYYHLLANRRRRLVIARLSVLGPGESMKTRALARQIAGVEMSIEPEAVSTDDYQSVYNGLIQDHLDPLADARVVVYDDRSRCVGRGPAIHAMALVLVATIVILRLLAPRTPDESGE
jgi:hypothetical protein